MRRLLALLLVVGTGCAGVALRPHALEEAVRVEEVGLSFSPAGVGELTLRLEVENPTLSEGEVRGVDFELSLDGRRYAVGTRGVVLPLGTDERRTLTVSFPLRTGPVDFTEAPASPRTWRVEVAGGVALAFGAQGETVRLLPFRARRSLRLAHFRPDAPARD